MAQTGLEMRVRLLSGHVVIMGPGRADLLMHIAQTGSIAAAGRQMGMSYKRAWALVEAMNAGFEGPLVAATKGGAGGGGAHLTALGARVLAAYRGFEAQAMLAGKCFLDELGAALAVPPGTKPG
ncbi:MAG: LysR family transcriptional regulator [Acidocella sp.]|nr:LysR family transcriptional regulator [Acidocella sp.]